MSLTKSILEGNRLALVTLIDPGGKRFTEGRAALAELFPHTGKSASHRCDGAPGTGNLRWSISLHSIIEKTKIRKLPSLRWTHPVRSQAAQCSVTASDA